MASPMGAAAIRQPGALLSHAVARPRKGQAGFGNILNECLQEKGDAPSSSKELVAAATADAGVPPPVASQANAELDFLLKVADFINADSAGTALIEEILNSQADEVASAKVSETVQAAGTTEETLATETAKPKTTLQLVSDLEGWEKDFLAKALGNPDYLPKNIAAAWQSSQNIASDLAKNASEELEEMGFTGSHSAHKWFYCGVAFVDGEYKFEPRAYLAQSFLYKAPPQELHMPWETRPKPPEFKWFPDDDFFEASRIMYDKLSCTVQRPGYQQLAERYAVDESIYWLASKDKEFAKEYDINPREAVSNHSDELVWHMSNDYFNASAPYWEVK